MSRKGPISSDPLPSFLFGVEIGVAGVAAARGLLMLLLANVLDLQFLHAIGCCVVVECCCFTCLDYSCDCSGLPNSLWTGFKPCVASFLCFYPGDTLPHRIAPPPLRKPLIASVNCCSAGMTG